MDVDLVKEKACSFRPAVESYKNCGYINREICTKLNEAGIDSRYVEGNLTKYSLRGTGPEHAFVVIEDEQVSGDLVIVDGAINQFCIERKQAGEVFFSLGAKDELPIVAVLTPGDDLYDKYMF